MIDVTKITPYDYGKYSRDYQLLARVLNAAYNNILMNIDSLEHVNDYSKLDESMLDVASTTIGFFTKKQHATNLLRGVVNSFKQIVRFKGTLKSVEMTVYMLLNSLGISSRPEIIDREELDPNTNRWKKSHHLDIFIPDVDKVNENSILDDIFNYILPAGYTYSIYSGIRSSEDPYTHMILDDTSKLIETTKTNSNISKPSDDPSYIMNDGYFDTTTASPAVNTDLITKIEEDSHE